MNLSAKGACCVTATLAILAAAHATPCHACYGPSPLLWTVVSISPGRTAGIPDFCYDPATGIVSVDTRGLNGIADTIGNTGTIAGDDVGIISMLVTGPPHTNLLLPAFGDGIAWISQYFLGRQQTIGTAVLGQYLPVGITPISQYPTGLTPLEFGEIEIAINFAPGAPGGIMTGYMLPEPRVAVAVFVAGILALQATRPRERRR